MKKETIKNALKCVTIAGLVASVGAIASGCSTSCCSSCKGKNGEMKKDAGSSCSAKKGSSCSAQK